MKKRSAVTNKKVNNAVKESKLDMAAVLSLFFTVIYFAILCKTGQMTITYDTAVNLTIANGDMIGYPNPHLLFVNYVFGLILSFLYRAIPLFNWFNLLLLFSMYFSLWAILYKIMSTLGNGKLIKQIVGGILAICLFNFLFYENLMSIYFLNCAVITGLSGAFYVVFSDKLRQRDILISTILIVLCAGLRFSVFKELSPFFAIILLARLVLYKEKKATLWLGGSLGVIILFIYLINSVAYTGIYSEEKEINHIRAAIQDYDGLPKYEGHEEVYSSLGMSEDEYRIMDDCWGISDFLNTDVLSVLLEVNKSEHSEIGGQVSQIRSMVSNMIRNDYPKIFWILEAVCLVCACVLSVVKKNWKTLSFFCVILLTVGCEIIYLAYKGRMPVRVTMLPLLVLMFSAIAYLLDYFSKNASMPDKHEAVTIATVIVGFVLFVGVMSETKNNYEKFRVSYARIQKEVQLIDSFLNDQDNLYLCHGNHDALDLYKPVKRNYMGWGGWISETIDWKTNLLGEYDDIWEALANRQDLRFNVADSSMEIIKIGLENRGYNREISYEILDIDGDQYKIWSIVSE